ncbi:MAG: SGNH/GDSL hydrolase family protein [Phycisphaeraceae bacterium]|nr:SGNH/GDSL hydrolase family protein [Phycisphaeraceae bacterium]
MTAEPAPRKILFLGNSYTGGIVDAFKRALADSPWHDAEVSFVWAGGATINDMIENGRAREALGQADWDVVILQEQSLMPALGGRFEKSFHDAVATLVPEIREAGAEPILYMTWGRRDGAKRHPERLPDFATMQQRLSDAYREAARRHDIRVAPVGEAWAQVREHDDDLGRALYQPDGSHPTAHGAYVATCVFFRVLFDAPLNDLAHPDALSTAEAKQIRQIVSNMPLASR